MSNTFFISDTHFGHDKCCTVFKREDGTPLRPFANAEEMDEAMVDRWNSVVKKNDKVYHLGDVVINKKSLPIMSRLNGEKRLIMGNHDIFGSKEYLKYFYEVSAYRVFVDQFILTHMPLHPDCVSDRFKVNVHGHLHANRITIEREVYMPGGCYMTMYDNDPRYFNVSVEQINYTPISIDDLRKAIS